MSTEWGKPSAAVLRVAMLEPPVIHGVDVADPEKSGPVLTILKNC